MRGVPARISWAMNFTSGLMYNYVIAARKNFVIPQQLLGALKLRPTAAPYSGAARIKD